MMKVLLVVLIVVIYLLFVMAVTQVGYRNRVCEVVDSEQDVIAYPACPCVAGGIEWPLDECETMQRLFRWPEYDPDHYEVKMMER